MADIWRSSDMTELVVNVARVVYQIFGFGSGRYEEAAGTVLFRQKKL
jgi:hypothetical protein